jgi:hypothetical protein
MLALHEQAAMTPWAEDEREDGTNGSPAGRTAQRCLQNHPVQKIKTKSQKRKRIEGAGCSDRVIREPCA